VSSIEQGIIFIRSDSPAELGFSIARCTSWCEAQGIKIIGVLAELGDALAKERPVLEDALLALRRKGNILVTPSVSDLWGSSEDWKKRVAREQLTSGFRIAETTSPEALALDMLAPVISRTSEMAIPAFA
jgi:hypothetical protein